MSDETKSLAVRGGSIAKQLNKSLQIGGLDDLVRVQKAQNIWLLLDCSGSMSTRMKNGKSRIQGLREAVDGIQTEKRMSMIQFGQDPEPSVIVDSIPNPSGGTPLGQAIDLARKLECSRCIVISDGQPDYPQQQHLDAAVRFGGRIDVVFVGDPGDPGEEFLKRLAMSTGGESFTGDLSEPKQLTRGVVALLTDGKDSDDEDDD
jgi:Mg-chelatase subunit ChlD